MLGARNRAAWSRPVFVVDGRIIAVGEVILAAHGRGDLTPAWHRLLQLIECEKKAAVLTERTEGLLDEARLQSLSEQFRYARELITAEETERWLEDRGLTLDDFRDHLNGHYWAEALDEPPAPAEVDYASASDALWDRLVAELLLSGDLDRMAERLSWAFAAAHAERDRPAASATEPDPPGTAPSNRISREDGPARFAGDRRWLEDVQALEAAYRRHCESLMAPDRLETSLASMRLPLTRVDLETVDVDSHDAVREVVMCVREDGLSLSEVAAVGGYPYQRTTVLLQDLPPDVQQDVACAMPGEMLAPQAHADGFRAQRLVAKADPDLADEEVRGRVQRHLLERHFSELSATCVRWLMVPSATP